MDIELDTRLGATKLVVDLYLYHYIKDLRKYGLTEEEIVECIKKEIGKYNVYTHKN